MAKTLFQTLGQMAPERTLWQQVYSKSLPISIILIGVLLAAALLAILRGRQTPAGQLPKSQRWLVLAVIAVAIGFSAFIVIRAI